MTTVRSFVSRLRAMFRRRELDARVDQELRFHVEMQTEENVRRGMSPKEARRQALLSSGGLEQTKESHRDVRGLQFLESVLQDLRFAFRSFRRNPGSTAAAVLTLALGLGVGTAVFSVVNALLFKPLPYENPDRLVMMWSVNEREGVDVELARSQGRSILKPQFEDLGRYQSLEWLVRRLHECQERRVPIHRDCLRENRGQLRFAKVQESLRKVGSQQWLVDDRRHRSH